jgi:hypothetical protein
LIQILNSRDNADAAGVLGVSADRTADCESTMPAASGLAGPPQAALNGRELSISDLPGGDVVTEIGYDFASEDGQ